MIILTEISTGEEYQFVDVYLAARPYQEGYIKVKPLRLENYIFPDDPIIYTKRSSEFKIKSRARMNGDFCKEHDMDMMLCYIAGLL
jgi:hypothetical protein